MRITLNSTLVALVLSTAPLADHITGRVLAPNGTPLAGVNIDALRADNGNDQDLLNDGTNATGDFLTTIAPGVYDIYFYPPRPPATTHQPLVLRNVVVAGTKNLGTLQLQPGVSLSGVARTEEGSPVSNVFLQIFDQSTGLEVPFEDHKTNAFGNFIVAVPTHALELRLDASAIVTPVLASRILAVPAPAVNTNLGTLTLEPGMTVTGHVQRSADATPVNRVDLDFKDSTTGVSMFTPHDNTDTLGNFSVVVPAGTFDVELCPTFASRLVAREFQGRVISGDLNVGTVLLNPGFVMSGVIRSFNGTPQVDADVDVHVQSSGNRIALCSDNTDAAGNYRVVVPAGTHRVSFHPANFGLSLGSDVHQNVLVSGDFVLDGSLPFCAAAVNYGTGLAGAGGFVPHLTVSGGAAASGNVDFAYELQNGRGGALAVLLITNASANAPFMGGHVLVRPAGSCCSVRVSTKLDGTSGVAGAGSKHLLSPFALSRVVGLDVFAQFFVSDSAAPEGWAFSDGVRFRVCP